MAFLPQVMKAGAEGVAMAEALQLDQLPLQGREKHRAMPSPLRRHLLVLSSVTGSVGMAFGVFSVQSPEALLCLVWGLLAVSTQGDCLNSYHRFKGCEEMPNCPCFQCIFT